MKSIILYRPIKKMNNSHHITMELILREAGIYYDDHVVNGDEPLTEIPKFTINKLWVHVDGLELLEPFIDANIKWLSCDIEQLEYLINNAKVKSCCVDIKSDSDMIFINNLTNIKIKAYVLSSYVLNEGLLINPKIRYAMYGVDVHNLSIIRQHSEYLQVMNNNVVIENYADTLKYIEISGTFDFEHLFANQTSLTCIKYWPRDNGELQKFIDVAHGVPNIKFIPAMLFGGTVDITPLLNDPAVVSIRIDTPFDYDVKTLEHNTTLLKFSSTVRDLKYKFIKEQVRNNNKLRDNKRFSCTKSAQIPR